MRGTYTNPARRAQRSFFDTATRFRYTARMVEATATIRNSAGIHCRPSAAIVKGVGDYPGRLEISTANGTSDPRSIMGLLSLCLEVGTRVRIVVDGPDETATALRLVELLEMHYDFPTRLTGEDTMTLLDDVSPHAPPTTML